MAAIAPICRLTPEEPAMPKVAFLPHFISQQAKILEDAGIDSGKAEVEWILCHLLDVDRLNLYLHGAELLDERALARFDEIIVRRLERYPLQFILEEAWFYGRKFYVNPSVMAPAPETEVLCELALKFIEDAHIERPRVLDIGTGSGVIAVTLAAERNDAAVVALDISPEALEVARRNARDLGAAERIDFRLSNFYEKVAPGESFDLILSNPPYISEKEYPTLQQEVLHDPRIAMTAGEDGLDAIREIIRGAPGFLAPEGRVMFEIGFSQADAIEKIVGQDARYLSFNCARDLNRLDRIAILRCR